MPRARSALAPKWSIIQDGKLVGAVTHVMVADPTEGYGIFIENMLSAAQQGAAQSCITSDYDTYQRYSKSKISHNKALYRERALLCLY